MAPQPMGRALKGMLGFLEYRFLTCREAEDPNEQFPDLVFWFPVQVGFQETTNRSWCRDRVGG